MNESEASPPEGKTPLTPELALALIEQERLDDFADGLTQADAGLDAHYTLASAYRRQEIALTLAQEKLAAAEKELFIQTESAKLLGRVVNEKDADRIYFRDKLAATESALAAAKDDPERLTYACSNKFIYPDFVIHVLKVGGTGDVSDCRAFIDEARKSPT